MPVGFIGLGTLGSVMAMNVIEAGHKVIVHDVASDAARPHLAAGAQWADSPRQVATACDVVLTSLPGPPEAEAVALGADGILAGLAEGGVHVDLSTNAPTVVRRIHAAYAARGRHLLDSPVSGGPAAARQRKLALWVSGDRAAFDRTSGVLESVGARAIFVGPSGAASVTKLVNNCASFSLTAVLAEVLTLGVKAGADPLTLLAAVRQGNLGRTRTYDGLLNQVMTGVFDPASFALRLAHKDVQLAVALGQEVGVPMALAELTLRDLAAALERGWGDRDTRAFTLLQQERAGVSVAVDPARLKAMVANDA